MSRLFYQKLIVILTLMIFLGMALDATTTVQAQEAPVVEMAEIEEGLEEDLDEEDEPDAVDMINNWGTSKEKVYGAKKFLLEQDFAVEVEQVIEVCDLNDRQLKRLKIASKGAIKKAFEKWKKTGLQQFGMALGNAGNEDDEEQEEEEEITPEVYTDADDIDMQTMQLAGGMMNPFQNEIPTNSKFWKKALKASIGDEQHQILMKHRADRDQLKREKNVAAAVEAFAFELRLSDEQKQAFSELVSPKMLKARTDIGPLYEQYVLYYYASKASKSKLKKILSKAQLQKWKSAIGPAKQIGQMMEMQNAQNDDDEDDDEAEGTWGEAEALIEAAGDAVEGVADLVEKVLGE